MSKSFILIAISSIITAKVAEKTTLVNTGNSNAFVFDNDTKDALSELDYQSAQSLKSALHSVAPGKAISLASGTYNVELSSGGEVYLVIEKKPVAPPVVVPPVVVPPSENPPAENQGNPA